MLTIVFFLWRQNEIGRVLIFVVKKLGFKNFEIVESRGFARIWFWLEKWHWPRSSLEKCRVLFVVRLRMVFRREMTNILLLWLTILVGQGRVLETSSINYRRGEYALTYFRGSKWSGLWGQTFEGVKSILENMLFLKEFMIDVDVIDLGFIGGCFTWDNQDERTFLWKRDWT